ncbi:MAG: NADH-quinone oxidoreductase subunit L [Planctomycetes bacterium]|nr:NADH-quinone oxidoreductase subunit L [Planctomycetota bacterium]
MKTDWLWWILFLPLIGSALAGLVHWGTLRARRSDALALGPAPIAALIACLAMGASFALSVNGFLANLHGPALESTAWAWIDGGSVTFDIALVLDRLSSVMTLVITGIGLLIHIYAVGYMKDDAGYAKFFAYLNLFVFAMLLLVLSSSLLGLFVGWEGVGLCSYLLIGFWYQKGWPAEAAQKAFVVNRIGDAFFLLGSFVLVHTFGTLDLSDIGASVAEQLTRPQAAGRLGLAALLLFGGACGKSAQAPLFVWLPDAMAGPTPVSALIHAATMVTAGIYLVVRLCPLFAADPAVLFTIGTVGAITAFIAGSTALAQRDLKGVLAYSTVSQLGYMFLALGSGAFASAIFHLVTHAFFKALLFLGAGSVIHGMHDEQDMHKMGGLRRHMPRTFITFTAGAAALSGLPILSGFFSKDEILAHTFAHGGAYYGLWAIGILTAAMTAYYSWRMVALTFFGTERFSAAALHPHESPSLMTVPLMVLAVLAVAGGILGLPPVFHLPHLIGAWLEPVVAPGREILAAHAAGAHGQLPHLSHKAEWILLGLGSLIALAFAHRGFHGHAAGTAGDERSRSANPRLFAFLENAWGVDAAYRRCIVQPVKLIAFMVSAVIDAFAIDGLVNGLGYGARACGTRLRRLSDGTIASYGLWMGAGAVLLAFFWMWAAR